MDSSSVHHLRAKGSSPKSKGCRAEDHDVTGQFEGVRQQQLKQVVVILVGHSLGGVTISGVADQMPERIKQLIYLDAVLLESGSRWSEAVPPEVAVTRRKLAQESTGGLSLPPPKASVFGIYPAADQAWVERRMTPQPFRTFDEVIHLAGPLGNHLPKIYIDCVEPALPTLVAMKTLYRGRADWPFVEIKCGHDAMIAAPAELAQILLRFV